MGDGGTVGLDDAGSIPKADRPSVRLGRQMTAVLAGSWRHSPAPLEMSAAALGQVTMGLLRSKAGALGWWRVRQSSLRTSPAGNRLREAYHNHSLQAALHGHRLSRIVTRLRQGGVEPLLVKGPAIARLYPERGLRPFEDLDFCVRPDQHAAAAAILNTGPEDLSPVDLHRGVTRFYARSWDDVYGRSQLVTFGAIDVRILAPEDCLRFHCLHQLRHGFPTPLWLCDVAVVLESRPAPFDWDLALGSDRRQADWVACTIGLAHQLLGVPVDDTPVAERARHLPKWLVSSVLEGWGRRCPADYQLPALSPDTWDLLARAPETIRQYWPSPVAATVHLRRSFGNFPRMPIQVVDAFARLVRFGFRRLLGRGPDSHE
jgi:hypothetical protein